LWGSFCYDYRMNCIFCRIINKEVPGTFVYEDDDVAAIIPKEQVSPGHTLVIPKNHYTDVFDIDDEVLRNIASVSKKLSKDIITTTDYTSVNLLNASGKDAQQSVFHFHLHIVPRKENDGLDLWIKRNL